MEESFKKLLYRFKDPISSLKKYGISCVDEKGEYKSVGEILEELNKKMNGDTDGI